MTVHYININRLSKIMKAQLLYPYDSAILGLENLYYPVGNDSFYINSPCILATWKIIKVGKELVLFQNQPETGIKMTNVVLQDCFYYKGKFHLIVQDIRSQSVFSIHQQLECPENECKWVVIDINYFNDRIDARAIEDYCGCTAKNEKNSGNERNVTDDDLLEFEF
jgi:hypothetical protein